MATKSIEERAKNKVDEFWNKESDSLFYSDYLDTCVELAIEQDRIARAEERERCVNTACSVCCDSKQNGGRCASDCGFMERFRKAIEEGGEV